MTHFSDKELDAMLRDHYGKAPLEDSNDDKEFESEVNDLLDKGDEAIFRGVRRSMLIRMGKPLAAIPKPIPAIALAGAVLAACFLSYWAGSTGREFRAPTGELAVEYRGDIAALRGNVEPGEKIAPRYAPDGTFTLEFKQAKSKDTVPAVGLAVFVVEADGTLRPARVAVSWTQNETQISFTVEGRADAVLGPEPGLKTLAFGFIGPGASSEGLEGKKYPEAQARSGIRWETRQFELALSSAAASTGLYHYARRVGKGVSIFTAADLPRVRVVGSPQDPWELRYSDPPALLPFEAEAREGFVLLKVTSTPAAPGDRGELQLWLRGRQLAKWAVEWAPRPEDDPLIAAARKEAAANRIPEAEKMLAAELKNTDWTRYFRVVELGRFALRRGRGGEAWSRWSEARALAAALGSPTEEAGRLRSLAFLDLEASNFPRARAEIQEARRISRNAGDETGIGRADYLEALWLQRMNAPNAPLLARKQYSSAYEAARARGDDDDAEKFLMLLATLIAEYDDPDTALTMLDKQLPARRPDQQSVDQALNRAYIQYLAFERRGRDRAEALRVREEGLKLLERFKGDGRPAQQAHLISYLIRYDISLGDAASAKSRLEILERISEEALGPVRWKRPLLAADVAIAAGKYDSALETRLRALQEDARRVGGGEDLDVSITSEALLGDLRRLAGDVEGAERSYRAAIAASDSMSRRFAGPRARAVSRARRAHAEENLVELLLARGRVEDALEVAELARMRSVQELLAQARVAKAPEVWDRYVRKRTELGTGPAVNAALQEFYAAVWSKDLPFTEGENVVAAFRALPPSEAVLSVVRTPGGWQSFWVRGGVVRSAAIGDDPLVPWLADLEGLERLYVSPGAHKRAYDLAVRRLDGGGVIGARAAVVLLVHAPAAAERSRIAAGSAALIVADPGGDLPEARAEASNVARLFPRSLILAGERATRESVLESWHGYEIFSFGGHARQFAGDGWSTKLDLSLGTDVRMEDVLVERPSFQVVLLGGCATAGDDPASFGLPHAFVAGGSRFVLATAAPVNDAAAREFVQLFFGYDGARDAARAFRLAVAKLDSRGEKIEFRLWSGLPRARS